MTTCAFCSDPLTGGKDTFGSFDWPLCSSCRWHEYDILQEYKEGIGDLSCCELGRVLRLADKGYRLPNPDEFLPPKERGFLLCPECGGLLHIEVQEWDALTGFPTVGGILVGCLTERRGDGSIWQHRYFQSDWDVVCADAANWVMRECMRRLVAMAEAGTP